jgi:CheY-like chemotaxis protein
MDSLYQNLIFENKKILFADDEPDIVEVITYHLKNEGFNCKTAKNGNECLDIIETYNPDILLLDIMMPGKNGIEVCSIIRRNPRFKNLIIIFLTALSEETTQIKALETGGDEFISKPVSTKLLITIIKAHLRNKYYFFEDTDGNNKWSFPILVYPIFTSRRFNRIEKNCFIIMPFNTSWSDRVHKKIGSILRKLKYKDRRADNIYGHNILEDIWSAINEATCIIADITGRNPNVFYEIGIAHTLGKDVILITQNEEDIPFDFKHFRHIIYADNIDGFSKLEKEIPNFLKYF